MFLQCRVVPEGALWIIYLRRKANKTKKYVGHQVYPSSTQMVHNDIIIMIVLQKEAFTKIIN
jgi:hypothetical protein